MDVASERVCYVHCNFCNTILAVSVPCSSLFNMVTVRCGHCANLLPVNMGPAATAAASSSFHGNGSTTGSNAHHHHATSVPQPHQHHHQPTHDLFQRQQTSTQDLMMNKTSSGSSSSPPSTSTAVSKSYNVPYYHSSHEIHQPPRTPIPPPEKRQRVPSAYNKFIKEEIQRIKTRNPEISHREAFSMAAKNWAHFPHIHFGLNLDGQKQAKLQDHTLTAAGDSAQRSQGFF